MTLKNLLFRCAACVLLVGLSACGGGSGDSSPSVGTNEVDTTAGTQSGGTGTVETQPGGTSIGGDGTSTGSNGDTQASTFPPVYATPAGIEACSVDDIKHRVDFDMRDYYIYYDQVPRLSLDDYDSPERLIRDLRVDPDIYSYVTDAEDQNALVEGGRSGGFGFWFWPAADGVVRFREILAGSPADQAGILRGDELLTVNGIGIGEITEEEFNVAFDPDNAPVLMSIRTGNASARNVLVNFEDFAWQTAGPASRYVNSGGSLPTVGYLPIRIFLETTRAEIDQSLADLEARGGFDDLIVDLRYNPGGRTHVARHIASVVGGAAVANEVFLIRSWNDKYSQNDSIDYFDEVEEPLNLPRVFVLVTEFSSSASEVFINTLKPYMEVIVVGGTTDGKPFTSNSREYCGKSINAMRSLRTNASLVSVAGGIQPSCRVNDNWETVAESSQDPLVRGALTYIESNTCPAVFVASAAPRTAAAPGPGYRAPEPFVSEE